MYLQFDNLPNTARVWVYQSDRVFTKEEETFLTSKSRSFLEKWASHGADLSSSSCVLYGHFLVLSVDESINRASGCSIDDSVNFVKKLENQLNVDFFDRTKLAYLKNEQVEMVSIYNLEEKISNGTIDENTLVFNNLIFNKGDIESNWIIPAGESWMKRHFKLHQES